MFLIFSLMGEYSERTAAGLQAEPLNAISNASFLIAAWVEDSYEIGKHGKRL